ncbi:hypothetical protein KR009_008434, partial [Drosophila setifemur]
SDMADDSRRSERVEKWSRFLLIWLYRTARFLSLLSSKLDKDKLQLRTPRRGSRNKILSGIWRCLVVFIYAAVWPIFNSQLVSQRPESYADLIALLQNTSVTILAVISFVIQARCEKRFGEVLNKYLSLYQRICSVTRLPTLFPEKFVVLFLAKLFLTLCGCIYELIPLLKAEHFQNVFYIVSVTFGIYMWLGTLVVLDACFLGFLVSGIMYEHMSNHLMDMLQRMKPIDPRENAEGMSRYRRMMLLGDFADEMDACAVIYSELYEMTNAFRSMLEWQILFYIYLNFINICLMLYQCTLKYLTDEETALLALALAAVKMANLVLLILIADRTVYAAEKPLKLPLDIVCSDMDHRWDDSVETFLCQLQTQRLEIKVLGFFHLSNEFIIVILSAIISYLFILLQFGMTGGFEATDEVKNQFQ